VHAWKRLDMSFSENSDTIMQFLDPNFLTECEISAIRGRFSIDEVITSPMGYH